jgi:hypothetical protein
MISRRHRPTRHDPRNGVACCPKCHDNRKVLPWLQRTDPARHEWILDQKRTVQSVKSVSEEIEQRRRKDET